MVNFLYNQDIFVWIQHGCSANKAFTLELSNRVIKRLPCTNRSQRVKAEIQTGPSCSKLTTSLVNDSLKFTSSDTQIC